MASEQQMQARQKRDIDLQAESPEGHRCVHANFLGSLCRMPRTARDLVLAWAHCTEMFRSRLKHVNFGLDAEKVVTESGSSANRHRAAHRRICATNGACERIYIRRSVQPSTSLAVKLTTVSSALRFVN